MKKIILLTLLATFLISCGSKTVNQSKKVIKGDWALDAITYSETGNFNVNLLSDGNADCFIGSTWHFISNNNTGTYNVNNSDCSTGERYFVFTIKEMDSETGLYDFLLKPTDEKYKSELDKGYRFNLKELSNSSMKWSQTVSLEGKPFDVYMDFSKITE